MGFQNWKWASGCTGQVVAGNIGAPERMQYGVIGSHVNLTQRIQACTSGEHILISETTRREVGSILRLGRHMEVKVKGVEQAIALAEVHGIGGLHKLSLLHSHDALAPLKSPVPVRCSIVEGGRVDDGAIDGILTKVSSKRAELRLGKTVPLFQTLRYSSLATPPGKSRSRPIARWKARSLEATVSRPFVSHRYRLGSRLRCAIPTSGLWTVLLPRRLPRPERRAAIGPRCSAGIVTWTWLRPDESRRARLLFRPQSPPANSETLRL